MIFWTFRRYGYHFEIVNLATFAYIRYSCIVEFSKGYLLPTWCLGANVLLESISCDIVCLASGHSLAHIPLPKKAELGIYKIKRVRSLNFFFLGRDHGYFPFFSWSRSWFLSFFLGQDRVFLLFPWILLFFSWSKPVFLLFL